MSDTIDDVPEDTVEDLRKRLDLMGVKYHPKAGVKKLSALIQAHLEPQEDEEPVEEIPAGELSVTRPTDRKKIFDEQMKLVRVVVHCNDPNKKEYEGDNFATGNDVVGTVMKYVPFGNTEGWHIPNILYQHIKNEQVQLFRKKKLPNGIETSEGYLTNAYNVEVLPPLSEKELAELGMSQKQRNAID